MACLLWSRGSATPTTSIQGGSFLKRDDLQLIFFVVDTPAHICEVANLKKYFVFHKTNFGFKTVMLKKKNVKQNNDVTNLW